MSDQFLNKAYGARNAEDTRDLYDQWAATYEAEVAANGYATPPRCAEALKPHLADKSQPILDFGCGTGLSGLALKLAGFETIDGVDVSSEMLDRAREKSIYRRLSQIVPNTPLPHTTGAYAAITAIGVIGAGAAPISVFDTLMNGLATGGFLVFSFNDHALKDHENLAKVHDWIEQEKADLVFKEYGDHLPGINLNSYVYIIVKN